MSGSFRWKAGSEIHIFEVLELFIEVRIEIVFGHVFQSSKVSSWVIRVPAHSKYTNRPARSAFQDGTLLARA